MATQMREAEPVAATGGDRSEAGVITDARRRHHREWLAIWLLLFAVIGAVLFLAGGRGGTQIARAHAPRPTWLAGAPLRKPTHLRLLVTENGGPASIVDIDDQSVKAVHGLGLPHNPSLGAPVLWPLSKVNGGALGVVTRRDCNLCAGTETHYLISPAGSVRRISELRLAPNQTSSTPVLGSPSTSWVLTHPRRGPCTLRAEPGSRPKVSVPCGSLVADTPVGSDTPAGLIISSSNRMLLVNPRTGHVLERSPVNGLLDIVSSRVALESGPVGVVEQGGPLPPLTLVNLSTGAGTHLRWPSILRYGYEVFPEPHSPMAAIEFMDPAYAGTQAADVWLLNTRTGAFTHVPGFPILEYLKFSGLVWTADHRLVIAARGPRRTALGIWQPGSHKLHVGPLPTLAGYTGLVVLSG